MAVSVLVVDSDRMLVDLLAHELQSKTVVISGFTTISDALLFLEDVQPQSRDGLRHGPDRRTSPELARFCNRPSQDVVRKRSLEAGVAVFHKDQPFEQLLGIIQKLIVTAW